MTGTSPAGIHALPEAAERLSRGAMRLVVGAGVLDGVGALVAELAPGGRVAVLTDPPRKAVVAGDAAATGRSDRDALEVVLGALAVENPRWTVLVPEGAHGIALDEPTLADAVRRSQGAALILSLGSGTITDLGKAVAHELGVPLVAVQTALSVNGFADPLSVLVQGGAKRTLPTTWPSVLVIDTEVVAAAPSRLARSGVGDAVAVYTAPADWYLACALGLDNGGFHDEFVRPTIDAAPRMADPAASEADRVDGLIETLTIGGLVLGDAGSTAPLSGCEHLFSHVLDMAAMAEGVEHDLHGAQVGVATVVSAALWRVALDEVRILDVDPASLRVPDDLRERVLAAWLPVDPSGALGEECLRAVERKFERWHAAQWSVSGFFADREEHRAAIERLLGTPEQAVDALELWGASTRFALLDPPVLPPRARWALSALPFMRDRMTLADLLLLAGRWNDALFDRVLTVAAEAGGGV
ncbi:iron-containing alcohol dehydrogenase [Schumannella soli]|uniref:iron-containing alcohol dehydrogenase n=1 Tax=Schumannella soli TaxID=2590779 RepID=UPI0015E84DFF|nr:iron-containing alcohol dehydrogenase [Schumannella soli]